MRSVRSPDLRSVLTRRLESLRRKGEPFSGRLLPPTTMASRFPRTYSRRQGTPGAFASKFDELLGPRRPIAPGPAIAASSAGPPAACAPILPAAPAEAAAPSKRRRMEPCARGTAERNSSHNDGVAEGRASPDGPATASATHLQSLASRLAVYEPCSSDEENEECNGISQHDLWSLSRRGRRGTQKMKAWNRQKKLDEDETKDVSVGFENATKCNSFVSGIGKDRSTAHKRQDSGTKNSSWSCLEERMAAEPGKGFAQKDTRVDCNDEDLWDRMRAKAEPLVCESKSLDSEVISLLGETGIKPAECVKQWNSTTEKASGLSKLGIWGIAQKEDGDVTERRLENYYFPRSKKDNFDLSDNLLNRKRLMVQPTETEGEDGRISFRPSNCRTYERVRRLDASFEGGDSTRTPLCSTVNSKEQLLFLKTSMQACRDPTTLPATSVSPVGVTLQDVRDLPQVPSGPATIASKDGEARNICLESAMASRPLRTPRSSAASYRNRKREAMLDFFGFDEADGDGESGDSSERPAPCAAYKLKYFGFDEIVGEETETSVDSGSEVPSTHSDAFAAAGRRDAGGGYSPDSSRASPTQPVCDFWSDSQDFPSSMSSSQETEVLEIRDEQITVQELQVDQHRLPEKRRDDVKKKIFHSPRKPIGKAVYNARHWTQPKMETELELPELLRIASAPAWLDYKERVQESKEATKDVNSRLDKASGMVDENDASAKQLFNAGLQEVFKAPSLPPRLVKKIAFPSNPDDEMVTSLKCHKDDKELYTVVRQVKAFNEVLEFGETQEFSDDVEYLLSGLKPEQPVNIRCLSTVSLAMKCAMPSFRMHLRAHGMVVKLFRLLSDAQEDQNLALCTAALMYVLSRDRLNMDLDRGCLELLIRLLELDPAGGADGSGTGGDVGGIDSGESREGQRHRERIRKLCERVHDRHLDLENITTAHLAMETLLSLTSRRAGDWFKEELRLLGGLDHIIDKVTECGRKFTEEVEDDELVVALRGAERCLRVLESVTVHNPENQVYLIAYSDSQLVVSTARVLCFCEKETRRRGQTTLDTQVGFTPPPVHYKGGPTFQSRTASPVAKALEGCLRAAFGVLLNLTNNNEWGSTKVGEQTGLISSALNCVLHVPKCLPCELRFDFRVLGLGLLVNLVELSALNRQCLVAMELQPSSDWLFPNVGDGEPSYESVPSMVPALQALVQLFLQREEAAKLAESKTDDLIKDAMGSAGGGSGANGNQGGSTGAAHCGCRDDDGGVWHESETGLEWVAHSPEKSLESDEKKANETRGQGERQGTGHEEEEEIDLNKALQHAGKHMEDCIVASYTALVLGCLCQESSTTVHSIRECLPNGDFSILTDMLHKFLAFMNLTSSVGTTGQNSIARVIECLERC